MYKLDESTQDMLAVTLQEQIDALSFWYVNVSTCIFVFCIYTYALIYIDKYTLWIIYVYITSVYTFTNTIGTSS